MSQEILSKLYLELANVLPPETKTSRELKLQYQVDKYGIALRMIAEGCDDPKQTAYEALDRFRKL